MRLEHLRPDAARILEATSVPSRHDQDVAAAYTYEVRCGGEIVSTGTLLLDSRPDPGDRIELGALSGTVAEVIALTDETRLIVDSSEPRPLTIRRQGGTEELLAPPDRCR